MPGFTAEPLPDIGAVRLVFDYSDYVGATPVDHVQMLRLDVPPTDPDWFNHVRQVRVRPTYMLGDLGEGQYGQPWEMFNTVDVWYDVEAPLDVPLYYMIETVGGDFGYVFGYPYEQLVGNPDFEVNVTGWQADTNAAISRETTAPLFGTGSLRIVSTAAATTGARLTTAVPVTAGRTYGMSAWLSSPAGGTQRIGVDWLNGANAVLSTSLSAQTNIPAGVAVRRSFTAVAPVGAVTARPRFLMNGVALGVVLLADRVRFGSMKGGDTEPPLPVTLASNGGGWFSEPTEPGTDVRLSLLPVDGCDVDELLAGTQSGVIFASHAAEQRASAGARFDVVDQSLPVPITSVRRGPTSTLTLAAVSFADRDRVHAAVSTGRVNLLRLPPEFGISDRYCDVADISTSALSPDLRLPYRVIDLPYASSAPPTGPIAGVTGTRFEDLNRYDTWNAFDAARLTSVDLLHGAGSPAGGVTL